MPPITEATPIEQAQNAIDGGAQIFQYRVKDVPTDEMVDTATQIANLCRAHNVLFIVNDRCDVAQLSHADGVHLGQQDMPAPKAREILGDDMIIGWSTHNLVQAKETYEFDIDYIAYGPVYYTPLKSENMEIVSMFGVSEVTTFKFKPVVAIGGLTENDLRICVESGVAGIAMIREIFGSDDPVKKIADMVAFLDKYEVGE